MLRIWWVATAGLGLWVAAVSAGELTARLAAADGIWQSGDRSAAVAAYRSIANDGANATDEADRLAAAGASASLALAVYDELAKSATDPRVRAAAHELRGDLARTVGARFVKSIEGGESFEATEHLAADRKTIVFFSSPYCGGCRQASPLLDRLAFERPGYLVVKVNVNRPGVQGIDWQSPTCKKYELHQLPTFQVYSEKGELEAAGEAAFGQVAGLIEAIMKE